LRVLVSDTSVVIDLERGGLLDSLFSLSLEFAVPDLLFRRELHGPLGDQLIARGLRVEELTDQELRRATTINRAQARLSVPDAFAYALAEARGWPLLTGDGDLRTLAIEGGIETHGVLWVLDELDAQGAVTRTLLHSGLTAISAHPRCRLPAAQVRARLKKFEG
jgi:hypothetical protein